MKVGYARCSTAGQDHDLQIDALQRAGCERVFIETASGTKADRPVLAEALEFVRKDDVLVVYSLSRLARSVRHLIEVGEDLRAREIGLSSITEALDTSTVSGRFLFTILAAMSQMEVELLRERTRHGLQAARARGRVGGRPKVLDDNKIEIARTLLKNDRLSVAEVAKQVGCSPPTLYRALGGGRRALAEARG